MKASILKHYGSNSQFEITNLEKPKIKEGHVLIKVAASSVNTVDIMIRNMGDDLKPITPELPAILGMDFAGIIEEIGDGVTGFEIGDEIYGCAGGLANLQGALAEYMLTDSKLIAHKPKTLSMREAAAIPLVGITAYEGLVRSAVGFGQKILVHGGSGGVGHIALQLAKYFGADVYSTGGGDAQLSLIEELGATAINYKSEKVADYVEKHTNGKGFDVVYDSVGGANLLNSFEAAALNGQISTTVSMVELDLSLAHFKGLSIHVVFMLIPMLHNYKREEHNKILSHLSEIIDAGKLKPVLCDNDYNLEEVGAAHECLSSGKTMGKVVVSI